jgi:hypothetical protein
MSLFTGTIAVPKSLFMNSMKSNDAIYPDFLLFQNGPADFSRDPRGITIEWELAIRRGRLSGTWQRPINRIRR